MTMQNVPDDWNNYWRRCSTCGERWHASEGHDCSGEEIVDDPPEDDDGDDDEPEPPEPDDDPGAHDLDADFYADQAQSSWEAYQGY